MLNWHYLRAAGNLFLKHTDVCKCDIKHLKIDNNKMGKKAQSHIEISIKEGFWMIDDETPEKG